MKTLKTCLWVSVFLFAGSFNLQAQIAGDVSVNSQLKILAPLSILCETEMQFPDVIPNVPIAVLTADVGGDTGLGYASSNSPHPASCIATGEVNAAVCVSVDNSSMNMDIDGYQYAVTLTPSATTLTLTGGTASVNVAGTLEWDGANATPDTYLSNVGEITVTYDCN